MFPEAREDFVEVSYVLAQYHYCFGFRHALKGLAATSLDRFKQDCLLVTLKLRLQNALAEIGQIHRPHASG